MAHGQIDREALLAAVPRASGDFLRRNAALLGGPATAPRPIDPRVAEIATPEANARRPRRVQRESKTQQAVMRWWKLMHRGLGVADERLLMAFPLQGVRTKANASRMKAEGMRAGTPDMFLAVPRASEPFSACAQPRHGLWIELKTETGNVRESQTEMLNALRSEDYGTAICYGYEAAIRAIEDYLR